MQEIYVAIQECPGYEVSNFGSVQKLNKTGVYVPVKISGADARYRPSFRAGTHTYYIHRLVGQYFVPNPKKRPHIDHIDRDVNNNHYTNLRWVTPAENYANRSGDANGKLDWTIVEKIRADYATGEFSMRKLAEKYGCNKSNVHSIVHNLYWKAEDYGPNGRYA